MSETDSELLNRAAVGLGCHPSIELDESYLQDLEACKDLASFFDGALSFNDGSGYCEFVIDRRKINGLRSAYVEAHDGTKTGRERAMCRAIIRALGARAGGLA